MEEIKSETIVKPKFYWRFEIKESADSPLIVKEVPFDPTKHMEAT
jgi:hypothetical protein